MFIWLEKSVTTLKFILSSNSRMFGHNRFEKVSAVEQHVD
jgi:hypothetical protein